MNQPLIALFGGTFDPIHFGHLNASIALAQEVNLSQINLLPNRIPPHKTQPNTNQQQRVEMLKLAIQHHSLFSLDIRELVRDKPSYTIDTLIEWRQQYNSMQPLAFIIGQDSLETLSTWHRWQELLDYCHLLVCPRKTGNNKIPEQLKNWINQHLTDNIQTLHNSANGYIYLAHTPLTTISSSEIRQKITNGDDCSALLPENVWQYIKTNNLYL